MIISKVKRKLGLLFCPNQNLSHNLTLLNVHASTDKQGEVTFQRDHESISIEDILKGCLYESCLFQLKTFLQASEY
jgi:hypothetical protein